MKKIVLIGSGGSGKSTLAKQLGERLKIDVYHLDALFWKPNWVGVPKNEQRLVQREEWIIDGNYGGTMEIRLHAADTIIFLDIPRVVCIYRAFKRILKYRNKTRPDMAEGCDERFNVDFFKWIWNYPKLKKPVILESLDQLSKSENKQVIILKSSTEAKKFIERVPGRR